MATYKLYKKTSATAKEEVKFPASSIDGLATVATSGSYNDLNDKPTIPTKTSELTNDSNYATIAQVNAKYTKPESGIPKSDLAEDVKTSLGKADTALQQAPVTSVNGKTGAVQLGASDVGALPTSTKYVVSVNGESGEVKNIAKTNSANTFTGDQTVTGNGSVSGNFTVGGNLTVNGTTTTVDSTTLQVKDKLIEVAHGNTSTLTTPAGLVAPKYDGTNSGALVFDSTGTAYVGDVTLKDGNIDVANSGLQPLATRTGLVGGNLVQYDSSEQTLKDSGKKISDLATTSQVNAKYTKPSGGIPKTDLASDVQTSLGKADSALQAKDISGKANLSGGNTFSGVQTINAPKNVSGSEQTTMKVKTSNGGAIIFGKEGANSGTMIRLDQADGTCRLRFRSSNTAGAMVWEQPEKGAKLHVDLGKDGSDKHRVTFPSGGGTLALTSNIHNGMLTIQKNGTDVQTFTANQSSSVTANITVPTKTSELTNDSGFLTSHQDISGKANLSGGNTFTGTQTLNSPGSGGYSINADGYIKGSWLQASSTSNKGSNTGKVCVFDNSGWIYYRTPAEILTEAGGVPKSAFSLSGTTLTITL